MGPLLFHAELFESCGSCGMYLQAGLSWNTDINAIVYVSGNNTHPQKAVNISIA